MVRVIAIAQPVLHLLFTIYPIIVLIIMFRPSNVAAFRDSDSASIRGEPPFEKLD